MTTGDCWGGTAHGDGVLSDDRGNRAEGRLVEGLKEGRWEATLADGSVIVESHVGGVFHGRWTFDLADDRFYVVTFEDGSLHGPWERRDGNGYRMAGPVRDGVFDGIVTISWPNGVEALVPYVDDEVHGEVSVARNGTPLGVLIYWKGKHVDGALAPWPFFPDAP